MAAFRHKLRLCKIHRPVFHLDLPGWPHTRTAHSAHLCVDRIRELAGKTWGGGLCFYINKGWCTECHRVKDIMQPSPRDHFHWLQTGVFLVVPLVGVYIPPQDCVSEALQHLGDQIINQKCKHIDSLLIVLGEVNRENLSHELPTYGQHLGEKHTGPLLHCTLLPLQPWDSDHCLVHLIQTLQAETKIC